MRGNAGRWIPRSGSSPNAITARRRARNTTWSTCPPAYPSALSWQLTHQRWAIEQQYQELKNELGFDHFEGRSWPGWQRHAVLTALAYTFLQVERQRHPSRTLTLPRVRAILQEVLTAHLFVTRPHYLHRMLKLQQVSLQSYKVGLKRARRLLLPVLDAGR